MEMNIRKDCKYAIACPTSMGVRITPEDRMAVHNSNRFYLQSTSAESNVLNVAASLGHECLVLTRFVKETNVNTPCVDTDRCNVLIVRVYTLTERQLDLVEYSHNVPSERAVDENGLIGETVIFS